MLLSNGGRLGGPWAADMAVPSPKWCAAQRSTCVQARRCLPRSESATISQRAARSGPLYWRPAGASGSTARRLRRRPAACSCISARAAPRRKRRAQGRRTPGGAQRDCRVSGGWRTRARRAWRATTSERRIARPTGGGARYSDQAYAMHRMVATGGELCLAWLAEATAGAAARARARAARARAPHARGWQRRRERGRRAGAGRGRRGRGRRARGRRRR